MKEFDYVMDKETGQKGFVRDVFDGCALLDYSEEPVSLKKLKKVKYDKLTKENLQKIFRFSEPFKSQIVYLNECDSLSCDETYLPTKEDLRAFLMKLKASEIYGYQLICWIQLVGYTLKDNILVNDDISDDFYDFMLYKTTGDLFRHTFGDLSIEDDELMEEVKDVIDIDEMLEAVQSCIETEDLLKRKYSNYQKEQYIYEVINDDVEKLKDYQKQLFKQFSLELADKDSLVAKDALAYGYYGGNSVFECDWYKSRDLLEELYQKTANPSYANSLGYIYYYGRCNNGIAQYDLAFKYYSIGSAGGNYESKYKMADMFLNGKYVAQNKEVAHQIYKELYDENIELFEKGFFDCKLADIALRLGSFNLSLENPKYAAAYYYLMQADFAIKKRRENYDYYGDGKVQESIEKTLENCRENFKINNFPRIDESAYILTVFLKNKNCAKFKFKQLKNGTIKIEMETISDDREYKVLIPLLAADKCIYTDKLIVHAKGGLDSEIYSYESEVTDVMIDDDMDAYIYCFDRLVARISCQYYHIDQRQFKKTNEVII